MASACDLLLTNATILTLDRDFTIHHGSSVAITGDTITAVGPAASTCSAAESIDCRGRVVMPGLVNAHTHVPMTLLRGLADDLRLDVSKESVGKWFDLSVDTVYWNAFSKGAGAVVGIPVQFATQSVQLEIRSPNRKFERYDRIAFELVENSQKQVVEDTNSVMTPDHTRIIWRIEDARLNWVYAIHWQW